MTSETDKTPNDTTEELREGGFLPDGRTVFFLTEDEAEELSTIRAYRADDNDCSVDWWLTAQNLKEGLCKIKDALKVEGGTVDDALRAISKLRMLADAGRREIETQAHTVFDNLLRDLQERHGGPVGADHEADLSEIRAVLRLEDATPSEVLEEIREITRIYDRLPKDKNGGMMWAYYGAAFNLGDEVCVPLGSTGHYLVGIVVRVHLSAEETSYCVRLDRAPDVIRTFTESDLERAVRPNVEVPE
ncbi:MULTISPECIES: hypothetical protein [unclassified Mameliella]|uniref:hypothetical protein n=1 Tax=Mameliella sp. LZ-28 TaxID=2484146 RepID=UPI00143F0931|nr:hypothetical protein [Mameliella sp. LZ-28]MCR9276241.1 hypothetical protein [Paracoccaceae bacterium]